MVSLKEHSVCQHAFRFMSTVTDLCTHECTFDCIRFWLHILQMSCIFPPTICFIPQNHFVQYPPPGTSPSFLPLDCGSFPRISTDAERHNQAVVAEFSLPLLTNTMQMSCAEHDPGCPEASTPVRCLVCQQENDCRENDSSLTLSIRCSALHMRHRRTGSRGDQEVGDGAGRARRKARKEGSMKRTE